MKCILCKMPVSPLECSRLNIVFITNDKELWYRFVLPVCRQRNHIQLNSTRHNVVYFGSHQQHEYLLTRLIEVVKSHYVTKHMCQDTIKHHHSYMVWKGDEII